MSVLMFVHGYKNGYKIAAANGVLQRWMGRLPTRPTVRTLPGYGSVLCFYFRHQVIRKERPGSVGSLPVSVKLRTLSKCNLELHLLCVS